MQPRPQQLKTYIHRDSMHVKVRVHGGMCQKKERHECKDSSVILTSLYSQIYSPSHRQKERVEERKEERKEGRKEERKKAQQCQ